MKEKESKKEELPKFLPPVASIYSVKVDVKKAKQLNFPEKIIKRLLDYYPFRENQALMIEFELKDFDAGIIESFNLPKTHKHYWHFYYLYQNRPISKVKEERLLALSTYVGFYLRSLGFDVPIQDIDADAQKIRVRMKVEDLEKINKTLKKYEKKLPKEAEKLPTINFDAEKGELFWVNEKGERLIFCLRTNSLRYKIIYFLADKKSFIPTTEIAEEFGKTTNDIRSIISKLRRDIKKHLKIDGEKIIENVPSKGYRVKNIKIIEESV